MDSLEGLLTVEEVAKKLKIAESTVYAFVYRGVLPAVKLGKALRFSPQEIQHSVDKMKTQALGKIKTQALAKMKTHAIGDAA